MPVWMIMSFSLINNFKRFNEFWWKDRGFSTLLFLLLILFFLSPFVGSRMSSLLLAVFYIPLLITGVASVTQSRFLRTVALVLATIVLIFNILHQNFPNKTFTGCWYFSIVMFYCLLIIILIHQVYRDGPVTRHRIRGAMAAYMLIGITWTYIYLLISLLIDNAFSFPPSTAAHPDAPTVQSTLVYYSFVTLTTLGYGDTVPIHPVARMFAILEALIGMLYPATMLARLVSLEIMYRDVGTDQKQPDTAEKQKE
jgi:hypothetical protein